MNDSDKQLESLLKPMDLPWNRKKEFTTAKLKWLKKNMSKCNDSHKNFSKSLQLICDMLKRG